MSTGEPGSARGHRRRSRLLQAALRDNDADVIVVGAGPSGSTTAYYLAQAGLDVLLLEKARFPREKVCGDGLTPRAVKALVAMGVDVGADAGWLRNKGLRVVGGGLRLQMPWPELTATPATGWCARALPWTRTLARRAQAAGAKLVEGTTVTGPLLDDAGQIIGVTAQAEVASAKPTVMPERTGGFVRSPSAPAWWSPPTGTPHACRSPWACASGTTGRSA